MDRQHQRAGKQGFTLIEILVVVAIIAILAAILFPVFARARENARRGSCQSNLKQIGMGLLQYVQDFDECMPPGENGTVAAKNRNVWQELIQPYTRSYQVFNCPSDNSSQVPYTTEDTNYTIKKYGSYAISLSYTTFTPIPMSYIDRPMKMSILQSPATTFFAGDKIASAPTGGQDNYCFYINHFTTLTYSGTPRKMVGGGHATAGHYHSSLIERHLDTLNVLWIDGHVKATRLDRLFSKTITLPNPGNPSITHNIYAVLTAQGG